MQSLLRRHALASWKGFAASVRDAKLSGARSPTCRASSAAWRTWALYAEARGHAQEMLGGAVAKLGRMELLKALNTWVCYVEARGVARDSRAPSRAIARGPRPGVPRW